MPPARAPTHNNESTHSLRSTVTPVHVFTFSSTPTHPLTSPPIPPLPPRTTGTSGYPGTSPPAPPAPPLINITVSAASAPRWTTGDNFICWNIDASANRGFFWRNISANGAYGAQLARQASALGQANNAGFSWLRFGGSGNDYLTYGGFGKTECPAQTSDYSQCMNRSTWVDLLTFADASDAKIIFGLSMRTGHDMLGAGVGGGKGDFPYPWDPNNAREILTWTLDNGYGHLIGAFELGNEQNTKYTGKQSAVDLSVLHNLTKELWPDAAKRPLLFGPDPHSLHGPTGAQLAWIGDWLDECKVLDVPVYGVTHHEYTEVDPSPAGALGGG